MLKIKNMSHKLLTHPCDDGSSGPAGRHQEEGKQHHAELHDGNRSGGPSQKRQQTLQRLTHTLQTLLKGCKTSQMKREAALSPSFYPPATATQYSTPPPSSCLTFPHALPADLTPPDDGCSLQSSLLAEPVECYLFSRLSQFKLLKWFKVYKNKTYILYPLIPALHLNKLKLSWHHIVGTGCKCHEIHKYSSVGCNHNQNCLEGIPCESLVEPLKVLAHRWHSPRLAFFSIFKFIYLHL